MTTEHDPGILELGQPPLSRYHFFQEIVPGWPLGLDRQQMSDIKENQVTIPLTHFEQFYLIYQITNSMPSTNNLVFKCSPGLTEVSNAQNTQMS